MNKRTQMTFSGSLRRGITQIRNVPRVTADPAAPLAALAHPVLAQQLEKQRQRLVHGDILEPEHVQLIEDAVLGPLTVQRVHSSTAYTVRLSAA